MTLQEVIAQRRAVFPRQYNSEPLTRKEIEAVLAAANWAPTHKRTEPWRFHVVSGDALTDMGTYLAKRYKVTAKKFSKRKYEKIVDKFSRSGCVIVIGMQRDPKERIPEWEEIAATAMAVQNMWLTATDLGLGSYWSSTSLRKEVDGFLKLGAGESCLGFFYMGRYDGPRPEAFRKPIENKVEWL